MNTDEVQQNERRKRQNHELKSLIRSGERLSPNEKKVFGEDFDELMQLAELLIKGGK